MSKRKFQNNYRRLWYLAQTFIEANLCNQSSFSKQIPINHFQRDTLQKLVFKTSVVSMYAQNANNWRWSRNMSLSIGYHEKLLLLMIAFTEN